MSGTDEIRWQQRLENFGKVQARLEDACGKPERSFLERAGLVRYAGLAFDLAWKTLRDFLALEGHSTKSPREVVRQALEISYLARQDAEIWLGYLGSRDLFSRAYIEMEALEAERLIIRDYQPMLRRVFDSLEAGKVAKQIQG